jgi:hypothetical protein
MASIMSVTNEELESAHNTAVDVANELNKMFKNTAMRVLLATDKVAFVFHPEVASGNLGQAYKEGTEHWVNNGALEQLMDMMDGVAGKRPKFGAGRLGSVWFDANLTGGVGDKKRTKKVRVTPMRDGKGGWNIMLDNTFDDEW